MIRKKTYILYVRRIVQGGVFLLFSYVLWNTKYPLEGFVNPAVFFIVDPLVMVFTAVAERVWLSGLVFALLTLAVTAVLGRVFCGWFCPLGATLDLFDAFKRMLRKRAPAERGPGGGRYWKYGLLFSIAVLALFGVQAAWPFDPLATFVRAFSFVVHPFFNNNLDKAFAFSLQSTDFYPPLENFYHSMKDTVLASLNPAFPHARTILVTFIAILGLNLVSRRFWCRYVCPLGAFLALPARFSLLRRSVRSCKGSCALCKNVCRMNAIRPDNSYAPEECVLCMDCTAMCPAGSSAFTFAPSPSPLPAGERSKERGGLTRKHFLLSLSGSFLFLSGCGKRKYVEAKVLRPPAALPEGEFTERCVRCGNCMKVCLTNVLQPALLESGLAGIWTPKLDTRIGYCEYQCTLCTEVCPTGAIKRITQEEKMETRLGLAEIHQDTCLPWATGEPCIVCEEHCPVSDKAIKVMEEKNAQGQTIKLPYVDPNLCVGCAICEFKCPVTGPKKGVTVQPL